MRDAGASAQCWMLDGVWMMWRAHRACRQLQMQAAPAGGEAPKPPPSIHVDVSNLELRARNLYTGDSTRLSVQRSRLCHVTGS